MRTTATQKTPLKLNEVALEDVTPAKKLLTKDVKFKCVVSYKDDEQEDASIPNDLSRDGSDETADNINGCVDDDEDVDTDMDTVEGEHCLLVENSENDEEPKYYFMLVPKGGANRGEGVGKAVLHSSRQNTKSVAKSMHLCDVCGHAFALKSALDEHVLTKHGGEDDSETVRTYHCTVCGELFDGEDKIREHLETSADCAGSEPSAVQVSMLTPVDVRRPFLCDTCGKNFSSALSLRMHTKLHTGERPFSCSTCGKSFVQKVQLVQHEQRHLGIRPYACEMCDRTFSQKGQLTLHTRLHTGERPFVCEFCDASYVSRPLLTQHRRLHTGERPHVCATCNKSFAHKESLIVHMRTHTGEKPFECTVCGNRYTQSHHLKGHMRTHTGEKPFACQLCEKTYKNRVDLRFHCTRVHGIDISKRKAKPLVFTADVAEAIAADDMETDVK